MKLFLGVLEEIGDWKFWLSLGGRVIVGDIIGWNSFFDFVKFFSFFLVSFIDRN